MCITVIFIIRIAPLYMVKESPILKGTYTCDKLPLTSMVFDLDDNYTFYYSYNSETEKGTYSKGEGNEHFINSPNFHNTKIQYEAKKHSFIITIGGAAYQYNQISSLPIISMEPEKDD